MYRCTDCGKKFTALEKFYERDDDSGAIKRYHFLCPQCKGENVEEIKKEYCMNCGKPLPEGRKDFCSIACRKKGIDAFEGQRKKYQLLKSSAVYTTVRELEKYNKEHGVRLSYGQYVATVASKKEQKNGQERRKSKIS